MMWSAGTTSLSWESQNVSSHCTQSYEQNLELCLIPVPATKISQNNSNEYLQRHESS